MYEVCQTFFTLMRNINKLILKGQQKYFQIKCHSLYYIIPRQRDQEKT